MIPKIKYDKKEKVIRDSVYLKIDSEAKFFMSCLINMILALGFLVVNVIILLIYNISDLSDSEIYLYMQAAILMFLITVLVKSIFIRKLDKIVARYLKNKSKKGNKDYN